MKITEFIKTNKENKNICASVVRTNCFVVNHDKNLLIYFFCVKVPSKKRLKDVEGRVSIHTKSNAVRKVVVKALFSVQK